MEKYGRTWKRCREDIAKIEYIWKVIDLPSGDQLWEENAQGRLFIVQSDGVIWETDF